MKIIDRERISKALDRSSKYLLDTPEFKIMQIFSKFSLPTISSNRNNKSFLDYLTEKERLELIYLDFNERIKLDEYLSNPTENELRKLQANWRQTWLKLAQKKWKRDSKIKAIQHKYQVSGLDIVEKNFGCGVLKIHQPDGELDLLISDFEILRSERLKIVKYFLKAAEIHKMRLYYRAVDTLENWITVNPELIQESAERSDWATIGESKYYIDHRELEVKGFTTCKTYPQSDRDRFDWELVLSVGKDNPQNSENVNRFCAKLGTKIPFS